jgi:hypothetical protein
MSPLDWHVSLAARYTRPMSTNLQVHVRIETIGEPDTSLTILTHEDSLATLASPLDPLERPIVKDGAHAHSLVNQTLSRHGEPHHLR